MTAKNLIAEAETLKDAKRANVSARFFKTGKGQYGEGDMFLGLTVPQQRILAKKYLELVFTEIEALLKSSFHEHRLTALLILVGKYQAASEKGKGEIVAFYLKNTKLVNNWDMVDLSADKILGDYLIAKDRSVLYKLARSQNLWEKRIAIVSTYAFIKNNQFADTIKIAELLLYDTHDLIQKAVGWMLCEVGKRDQRAEEAFLVRYYKTMPRTMLRYAIERFDDNKKKLYMARAKNTPGVV